MGMKNSGGGGKNSRAEIHILAVRLLRLLMCHANVSVDAGCGMRDAGFRTQDSGCRMQDAVDAAAPLGMTK